MRVVITGVTGFVGQHLAAILASRGHGVIGLASGECPEKLRSDLIQFTRVDLTSAWPVIDECDAVIHLAALSAVGPSFDEPQRYLNVNSAMVTQLGEAQLARGITPRTLIISSGAVYAGASEQAIYEESPIGLSSPYSLSKVLTEQQAKYYVGRGLDWTVLRPFNHIGPGQGAGFLLPDLYDSLQLAAREKRPLYVGNLTTRRDYTDVRDVCEAYASVLEGPPGNHDLYNVCSGRSTSGSTILALLMRAVGCSETLVVEDKSRFRPNDTDEIRGNSNRIKNDFGWRPSRTLQTSIEDFLAWRRDNC